MKTTLLILFLFSASAVSDAQNSRFQGNPTKNPDQALRARTNAKDAKDPKDDTTGSSDAAAEPLPLGPDGIAVPGAPVLPPAPEFAGSPRQGLVEIRRLAGEGQAELAASLAAALAERVDPLDERMLAELRYAGGVAHVMGRQHDHAAASFRSSTSLAGIGDELRLDSIYNEATARIHEGEVYREQIPEISVQSQDIPSIMGASPKTQADKLPEARESYQAARAALIERIRMDWRDPDSRANLEFVQMRLDELAKIEADRADANSSESSEGMESDKTDEGEGATKGEEESEDTQEEQGQQGNDPESEEESIQDDPEPGEGGDEGDDMADPEAEEQEDAEQQKQEEADTGQEEEELESESGGAQADPEMSKQEARLIFDRLNEIDQKASRLRAALMKTRMIEVPRDW